MFFDKRNNFMSYQYYFLYQAHIPTLKIKCKERREIYIPEFNSVDEAAGCLQSPSLSIWFFSADHKTGVSGSLLKDFS